MRTTKVLSITLPAPMLDAAKKRAKLENRTMSELVREALRSYEFTRSLAELQAYGEKRAREMGISNGEDVDRLIHVYREERRAKSPKRQAAVRKAS